MDSNKKQVIEALEKSLGVVSTACAAVDMPRSTFYNWLKEDADFKAAVDEIQELAVDVAESELHKLIKSGETTAIIFYLKTKGKKRGYIEKTEVDNNVSGSLTWNETRHYGTKPNQDHLAHK